MQFREKKTVISLKMSSVNLFEMHFLICMVTMGLHYILIEKKIKTMLMTMR